MGLFDAAIINDPGRLANLQLGLGLLGAASGTGRGIANAFGGAIQSAQQSAEMQRRRQMQDMQAEAQRLDMERVRSQMARESRADSQQQALQDLARQYLKPATPIPATAVDSQNSFDTGNSAPPMRPGGFDFAGYSDALAAINPQAALSMKAALAKDDTPVALGDGGMLVSKDGTVLVENKKQANQTELSRLMMEMQSLPLNDPVRSVYMQMIRKLTTHAPGTTVTLGSPVPITLPDGSQGLVQPANRPGEPPQLLRLPSGDIARPQDKPLTESQAKASTFRSQMEAAERELEQTKINPATTRGQADVLLAGGWTNFIASPEAQKARQAQEQWAESFLRFKTGAAATKDEVTLNVKTFFPQLGDSAAVVEQKKRMREQAIRDITYAAGGKPQQAPAQAGSIDDLVNRYRSK